MDSISRLEKFGEYTNTYEYKKDTIVVFIARGFTQIPKRHFEIEEQKLFDPQMLPDKVSPGTRRRIEEWLGERPETSQW